MTYDLDEQEQIDALKAWWSKYGNLVLGVITAVLLVLAAWQGWNWYQRNQATQAAGYFEALQNAARQANVDQVRDASRALRGDFGSTAYAPRGALVAAQAMLAAGDADGAREQLQWIIEQRGDDPLAPVAKVRLAGVLIDLKQYDAALGLVSGPAPAGFDALYADRRGDVLFAQGKAADARAAWQSALDAFEPASPLRSVVQLKINALAGAPA